MRIIKYIIFHDLISGHSLSRYFFALKTANMEPIKKEMNILLVGKEMSFVTDSAFYREK